MSAPPHMPRSDSVSTFSTFNSAAFTDARSHISSASESEDATDGYIPPLNSGGANAASGVAGDTGDADDNALTPQATITETQSLDADTTANQIDPDQQQAHHQASSAGPPPSSSTDSTYPDGKDPSSQIVTSQPAGQKDPSTAFVEKQDPSSTSQQNVGYHREQSECHEYLTSSWLCDACGCGEWTILGCWTSTISTLCGACTSKATAMK
ncbi:DEKNAAC104176 [Brettanomyces naardenensis]|uniref:DEKNAAC104176 n=1 Tax=Brettanomyces naardenensis TaxID=13370 RepID=A0A448YQG0_BRENA|nr:DEKNAAC104176 [Brettanomyces naardenensis]